MIDGELRYPKDDPLFKWLESHNEIFIREELERHTTALRP